MKNLMATVKAGLFILLALAGLYLSAGPAAALTLAESIETGLRNNPAVRAAEAKVQAASARTGQALSMFLPSLSGTAGYGRNYSQSPSYLGGILPDEATNVLNYSLNLQQNLFTFGKEFTGMDMAQASFQMAKNDLQQAKNDAIYNITSSYYGVLRTEKMLQVATDGLKTLEKHYKQIKVYFDAGLALKSDLLQVEAQVGNLRVAEIQARSGLTLARTAFNSVIGRRLDEPVVLADAAQPKSADQSVSDATAKDQGLDLSDLLKKAFLNRPDWLSFKLAERIGGDSVWLATAGYFPNLALSGSYGKVSTEYRSIHTTIELENWRAMLVASWNIFDGLNTPYKVGEAQANLAALQAQEKQVSDGIELDVTSTFLQLSAAREKLTASQIAADVAQRSLRLAQASYEANITTSLAVLDAETTWSQAQTNFWGSVYDLELAKARINKTVGAAVF